VRSVDLGAGAAFAPRVPAQEFYQVLFAAFAFFLGASIGSFLNVCIYRMPLGISVNKPKRSFCPHCKYQIPWHANLPLVTWIVQRGKCGNCGAPIAARYVLVELLTGLLFLGEWRHLTHSAVGQLPGAWVLALPYFTFIALLVVATFIDFEHYIIPDEITIGGSVAGVLFSAVLPLLHDTTDPLRGALMALLGAAAGFGLLWLVSVLGKMAFGKKTLAWKEPQPFAWKIEGERAKLTVGKDEMWWDELFSTEKDWMAMDCARLEVDGKVHENTEVRSQYERIEIEGTAHDLNVVKEFGGTVRKIAFRRDAMGFGDVKFMACIGAFLGWKAIIFTVMAASVIGALVGGITIAMGRREWSARIPFGPYLSLGALLWVFTGPELVALWMNFCTGSLPGE
jgi:leader peptidase (prepilin peptidase)/N-methyltransferase